MLCYEAASRLLPFCNIKMSVQVETEVLKKNRPEIPSTCLPDFAQLIKACWNDNPDSRPTMTEIVQLLKTIIKNNASTLSEQLVASTQTDLSPSQIVDLTESMKASVQRQYFDYHYGVAEYHSRLMPKHDAPVKAIVQIGNFVWSAHGNKIRRWNLSTLQHPKKNYNDDFKLPSKFGKIDGMVNICFENSPPKVLVFGTSKNAKASIIIVYQDLEQKAMDIEFKSIIVSVLQVNDKIWVLLNIGKIIILDSMFKNSSEFDIKTYKTDKTSQPSTAMQLVQTNFPNETKYMWVATQSAIYRYNTTPDYKLIDRHSTVSFGLIKCMTLANNKVWACGDNKMIAIFDANNGEFEVTVEGHDAKINSIITVGNYIFTCSSDKTIIVWNNEKLNDKYCSIEVFTDRHSDSIVCLTLIQRNKRYEVWSGSMDAFTCIFSVAGIE